MTWRWVRRAAAVIFGLAFLVGIGAYFWLRTSLPQTDGSVTVAGLSAPAEILRDENGIVTIRAATELDGYYALGFAHAQDRLFQMEFMRLLGAGRLSEVIGPSTLEIDKRMRVLGLHARAEAGYAELAPEVQAALDAYAAGVNAYLATRSGAFPIEFQMLWHAPEPWRPADSLVWGRLMAMQLSNNWREELFRFRLAQILSPDRLEALWPAFPGRADTAAVDPDRAPDLLGDLAGLPATFDGVPGASNSWAVDGRFTVSGKPLLANDPHLGLGLPNQWYLARIETPGRVVAGATAPGVPFMVIGHNGHVAWSFTTTGGDTQDLFVEKLVPGTPDRYATAGGDSLFLSRDETIKVRGEADVTLTVRQTAHGPVISDIGLAAEAAGDGEVVALAWTGLYEDDRTAEALYRMGRAENAAAFREALRLFHSPQQNIVFADTEGAVGFVAAGRVPVRKALYAGGQMPAPGWTGAYDWTGFLPFADLPRSLRPATGRIVTANNDITPPDYAHFIAARWEEPFRARRIDELLDGPPGEKASPLTAAEMGAWQMDDLSLAARDLLPDLLAGLPPTPLDGAAGVAAEILGAWDYRMDRDQAAPLIFTVWLQELDRRVFAEELGPLYADFARWNGNGAGALLTGFSRPQRDWCGLATLTAQPACHDALGPALEAAVAALASVYGDDPAAWRWGDAHQARFAHPLLDRLPLLGDIAATAVETDGDNFTVNRGSAFVQPGLRFPHVHGASLRAVFDLAELDRSLFVIPGGQSGNLLSGHFTDLVERWRDGRFLTIVGEGSSGLTLVPAVE
jgi:penicillin amidase